MSRRRKVIVKGKEKIIITEISSDSEDEEFEPDMKHSKSNSSEDNGSMTEGKISIFDSNFFILD